MTLYQSSSGQLLIYLGKLSEPHTNKYNWNLDTMRAWIYMFVYYIPPTLTAHFLIMHSVRYQPIRHTLCWRELIFFSDVGHFCSLVWACTQLYVRVWSNSMAEYKRCLLGPSLVLSPSADSHRRFLWQVCSLEVEVRLYCLIWQLLIYTSWFVAMITLYLIWAYKVPILWCSW